MHHRIPPSKNWVVQFKRSEFSTCDVPRPGQHKTVTEIIDQIHELILEDRRISAKSIAEQLGISREWVWSIIHVPLTFLSEWRGFPSAPCLTGGEKT